MRAPERTTAIAVTFLGALGFAILVWWLVPWDPVPGGPVEPVPVDQVFTPAEIARAEEYSRWARVWSWSGLAVSLLVVCWLGFTSAGRRLIDRLPGRWWVTVLLAVAAVEVIGRVATLPFAAASHQHRLNAGLSNQSWGGWLRDVVVAQLISIVVTGLVLVSIIGIARRWKRAWPAIAGLLVAVLVLLGSFVYPVIVEPLFNRFESLPAGELRSSILELAEREGVDVDDVLVSDASRRTTTLNAYVSGFGSTRRVVVYDNLVSDVERDQILSVVAHELAHAKHRDVMIGTVLGMAGAVAGVGLMALIMGRKNRSGAGITDPRAVPTLLALFAVASLLLAPIQNGISRRVETRADVVALELTSDTETFVRLQRELAIRSLADPTPPTLLQCWFGSHPTVLERIGLATR